jgi:hypothetical protein
VQLPANPAAIDPGEGMTSISPYLNDIQLNASVIQTDKTES